MANICHCVATSLINAFQKMVSLRFVKDSHDSSIDIIPWPISGTQSIGITFSSRTSAEWVLKKCLVLSTATSQKPLKNQLNRVKCALVGQRHQMPTPPYPSHCLQLSQETEGSAKPPEKHNFFSMSCIFSQWDMLVGSPLQRKFYLFNFLLLHSYI